MEERNAKIFLGISLLFTIICLIFVSAKTREEKIKLVMPVDFNQDWHYSADPTNRTLQAVHELSPEMAGKTITFYSNDSFVTAYVDNNKIYSFGQKLAMGKSPGSSQQFIQLPESIALHSRLKITIRTVYRNKFLSSYKFQMGNYNEVVLYFVKQDRVNALANAVIFMIGVLILMLYVLEMFSRIQRKSNLYLGILGVVFSVWSSSTLFFSQMFIENAIIEYYVNYFTLFALPLLLSVYLKELMPKVKIGFQIYSNIVLISVISVMHFAGIADYTQTIKGFALLQGICIIAFFVQNFKNISFQQQKLQKAAVIILVICIIMNCANFVFKSTFGNHSLFSKIGFAIYLGISLYVALHQTIEELALVKESEKIKRIAYTDYLTKLGNRYSFERDLQDVNLEQMGFVSLDLNNLKYYNDVMGHAYGDILIADAAKLLGTIYERVYRVGGDEFIAVLQGEENHEYDKYYTEMTKMIDAYNASGLHSVVLNIASGFSSYKSGDECYEHILMRADKNMYINKGELKERSYIR